MEIARKTEDRLMLITNSFLIAGDQSSRHLKSDICDYYYYYYDYTIRATTTTAADRTQRL